jgi:hypothetical protein
VNEIEKGKSLASAQTPNQNTANNEVEEVKAIHMFVC